MAKSNQNKKVIQTEDFSDVLDELLDKKVSLVEVNDLSKDEDIMDQLIMEDVFDVADEEIERLSNNENNREIEKENKKNIENIISEISKDQADEFSVSETTTIPKISPDDKRDGLNVDDLLNTVDEKLNGKDQEFTQVDTKPEMEDEMVKMNKLKAGNVEEVEGKTSEIQKEQVDGFLDPKPPIKEDELDIDDLLDSVDEESNIMQEKPTEKDEFAEDDASLSLVLEGEKVEKNEEHNGSEEKIDEEIASLSKAVNNLEPEKENKKDLDDQITEIQKNEVDAFSDPEQTIIEKINPDKLNPNKDGLDVDDLLDSVDEESKLKQEEPTEIDEFVKVAIEEKNIANNESVENSDELDTDSLITDFDISSDDEFSEPDTVINEPIEEIQGTDEQKKEIDLVLNQSSEEIKKSNIAIDELNSRVNQLVEDNDSLRNQIAALVAAGTNDDTDVLNTLDTLKKQQKSITRQLKNRPRLSPILTYTALGLAGFSVLLAGGLGAVGYGAQSDVTELSELVITLDEETDELIANTSKIDVEKLNEKIRFLISKNENLTVQVDEVKNSILSNSLEPLVDDLVETNDQTQQTIETLLAKVEKLEKRRPVKATAKPKKVKKVVKQPKWAVNLVSFKQEWYAKSKAAEFEKKGIPTDVIKVKVKGEDWFRLRVKGFKSKYDAASYAVKVKKTLNLGSVWVTKL